MCQLPYTKISKVQAHITAAVTQLKSEDTSDTKLNIMLALLIRTACADVAQCILQVPEPEDQSDPFAWSDDYVQDDHSDYEFNAAHTSSIRVHGPNNEMTFSELLHPQPEDDDPSSRKKQMHSNEAVPDSLSKFGKRVNNPSNLALCGAKSPGSKFALASAPCNQ